MPVSPLAGKPADPTNADRCAQAGDRLLHADGRIHRCPAQCVSFGTSGHRGCSLDNAFTEAHILAITQAICDYRKQQGIDGPLYIGIDTHALSDRRQRRALEVLAANGVEIMIDADNGVHADPGHLAGHPRLQPRPQAAPRRRHRHHAIAQSARGRRLQVQSVHTADPRTPRDRMDRGPGQRVDCGRHCAE